MIRKKIDELLDSMPIEQLEEAYYSIQSISNHYQFEKNIRDKGATIEFVQTPKKIITKWDKVFAGQVDRATKKSIYYHQYKWHIFSYKQVPCIQKNLAREAFDNETKDEFYVMYQSSPWVYHYQGAEYVVSTDFDSQDDIYIFDTRFRWTYVHTHESMCGPYFCKLSDS